MPSPRDDSKICRVPGTTPSYAESQGRLQDMPSPRDDSQISRLSVDDFQRSRLLADDFQRSRLRGVGPRLQPSPAFATMDGAGYGHCVADSTLPTRGWHGYSAPYRWRSPSWRGTVAMPALTSAPVGSALCPRRLTCTAQSRRDPPVSGGTEDGESATKTDPWESAPWSQPAPPTGPTRH